MLNGEEERLQAHAQQLAAAGAELDRQRVSLSSRKAAGNSRAALLIGSAAISSGVQVTAMTGSWQTASVFASLLAAVAGVLSLWPRGDKEVDVRYLLGTLYRRDPRTFDLHLLAAKAESHQLDEEALLRQLGILRVGFLCLVTAILFTALQADPLHLVPPTP